MTDEGKPQPCDQFTLVDSRKNQKWPQCDVCDQAEDAHETPGRRILSGGQIEELRRRIIIERFDKREEESEATGGQADLGPSSNGQAQDVSEIDDRRPT